MPSASRRFRIAVASCLFIDRSFGPWTRRPGGRGRRSVAAVPTGARAGQGRRNHTPSLGSGVAVASSSACLRSAATASPQEPVNSKLLRDDPCSKIHRPKPPGSRPWLAVKRDLSSRMADHPWSLSSSFVVSALLRFVQVLTTRSIQELRDRLGALSQNLEVPAGRDLVQTFDFRSTQREVDRALAGKSQVDAAEARGCYLTDRPQRRSVTPEGFNDRIRVA
jgi:hypothetical protein